MKKMILNSGNEIIKSETDMRNSLNFAFNLFNKIKKIIYEKNNVK